MIKLRKHYFEVGKSGSIFQTLTSSRMSECMYALQVIAVVNAVRTLLISTPSFLSFCVDILVTISSHILHQVSWRYVKKQQVLS